MNLYVLRHGQTSMNSQDLIVGTTDDTLTEEGIEQAKDVAKKIAAFEGNNAVDIVITSPLVRARHTAQIVADEIERKTGRKIESIIDNRLIEQNYGNLKAQVAFQMNCRFSR